MHTHEIVMRIFSLAVSTLALGVTYHNYKRSLKFLKKYNDLKAQNRELKIRIREMKF